MRLRLELESTGAHTAGFRIPAAVVDELGGGRRPTVVVTVGVHTWRSSIASMGGQFWLGVSAANREAAARESWSRWSFTRQKEAARLLSDAEKPETRARRLEKVLAELRG